MYFLNNSMLQENFQDTKAINPRRTDNQHNRQKKTRQKEKQRLHNFIQKTNDRAIRTPLKQEVNSGAMEG
jgi:hypothetical protein